MTTRYCGPGGSDAADGLSWANRKLTLNGVEDTPVAAGDTVYVGPGVYREMLTVDVAGTTGNIITYIGDVTGQNTDGIGGMVRITGSDNDTTATRASCITASIFDYRTFRGFYCDFTTGITVTLTNCKYVILEDCVVYQYTHGQMAVNIAGSSATYFGNCIVRRCIIATNGSNALRFGSSSATISDSNSQITNCVFMGGASVGSVGVAVASTGGISISNCSFYFAEKGINSSGNPAAGQTININNCIFLYCKTAIYAGTSGATFYIENYNTFSCVSSARTNVNVGANSVTYPPFLQPAALMAGVQLPQPAFPQLSQWSQVKRLAGTGMATDDLLSTTRPTTDSKKSWGAIQYQEPIRSTTQTYSSSAASLKLDDAGCVQFVVPVTAVSTTIAVRVYREADYAGTLPRLIIKQAGQADRTTTDAGSASAWNALTDTFTPAASPGWVTVCLQSLNTATSGSYNVYWDNLAVS